MSAQKKAKILRLVTPIVSWVFLALTITFVILAIRNSLVAFSEAHALLDKDIYSTEQIRIHYEQLTAQYGTAHLRPELRVAFSAFFPAAL